MLASLVSTTGIVQGFFFAKVLHQAIDGGEEDQQVSREQAGNERGEPVVVAEFQLGVADGVVLVDDRHDALVEQGDERVAGVEVAFPVLEIVVGEEHLGDLEVVLGEQLGVSGHEF